jgi:hypothetical protein
VAATPTPISPATEQQHHHNNNQDQFHRNSPLTSTSIRRAPKYSTAPSDHCSRQTCQPRRRTASGASDPTFVYLACVAPSARRSEFAASHLNDRRDGARPLSLCLTVCALFALAFPVYWKSILKLEIADLPSAADGECVRHHASRYATVIPRGHAPRPLTGAPDRSRSSGWPALERPRSRPARPTSRTRTPATK